MYLSLLKLLLFITGILFIVLFSVRVFYKFKSAQILSIFVTIVAIMLFLYILSCFAMSVFCPNYFNKFMMLMFGLSPFIIGRLAVYEKLKKYSAIQVLCVILSLVFLI